MLKPFFLSLGLLGCGLPANRHAVEEFGKMGGEKVTELSSS